MHVVQQLGAGIAGAAKPVARLAVGKVRIHRTRVHHAVRLHKGQHRIHLHASLGVAPAFDSDLPAFNDALARILASAKKHGVAPGIHVADAAQAKRRIAEGWQFIAISSEAGMMLAHAAKIVSDLGLGSGVAAVKY